MRFALAIAHELLIYLLVQLGYCVKKWLIVLGFALAIAGGAVAWLLRTRSAAEGDHVPPADVASSVQKAGQEPVGDDAEEHQKAVAAERERPQAVSSSEKRSHKAAVEAQRREREAFMKMSPEEKRQFRERKRAEMLARRKGDPRGMGEASGRRQYGAGGAVALAVAGEAVEAEESSRRSARAEQEELRAAALRARAEYEDSMGETRAANYRRRSVNYWMNRVKRQRERAAERELRRSSDVMGADAGASAADSQEQETKGKAE